MHDDTTPEGLQAILSEVWDKHPNGKHSDGCGCLTTEQLMAVEAKARELLSGDGSTDDGVIRCGLRATNLAPSEPMPFDRLAEIEASAATWGPPGSLSTVDPRRCPPPEMLWLVQKHLPDLIAEVRRHRGFIEYVATLGDTDNPAGAYSVLKELARRHLAGIPA